jgi:hypothetical protein
MLVLLLSLLLLHGIPAVEGLPSAVDICYVSIVFAAANLTFANVLQ